MFRSLVTSAAAALGGIDIMVLRAIEAIIVAILLVAAGVALTG